MPSKSKHNEKHKLTPISSMPRSHSAHVHTSLHPAASPRSRLSSLQVKTRQSRPLQTRAGRNSCRGVQHGNSSEHRCTRGDISPCRREKRALALRLDRGYKLYTVPSELEKTGHSTTLVAVVVAVISSSSTSICTKYSIVSVSYTHLTLPTIYSV